MPNNKVIITDSSLRDGNHSVKHTISLTDIKKYCAFAEKSKIPIKIVINDEDKKL